MKAEQAAAHGDHKANSQCYEICIAVVRMRRMPGRPVVPPSLLAVRAALVSECQYTVF
jgi:hypothetical protein